MRLESLCTTPLPTSQSRPTDGRQCCSGAILSSQPDFAAQKSRLKEVIKKAGHLVIFYPKFDRELNWIEY